jgi:hypothetical protein
MALLRLDRRIHEFLMDAARGATVVPRQRRRSSEEIARGVAFGDVNAVFTPCRLHIERITRESVTSDIDRCVISRRGEHLVRFRQRSRSRSTDWLLDA